MKAVYIGFVAAWVWVLLPIFYWVTAPEWWKTRTGRALMWLLGSTAGLFLLLLTGRTFGDYAGKELVQGAVYALVLGAGLRLSVLFIQLQRDLPKGPVRARVGWLRTMARKLRGRLIK